MVVAVARNPGRPGKRSPQVLLAHRKYAAAETSGLAVEVVEGPGPDAYDLKLLPPR